MAQPIRGSHCSDTAKQMKKNESLMSDIIRCFLLLDQGFGRNTQIVDGTVLAAPECFWVPIQYFITFGVNRLNGDDGPRVLTIRQSTYSKRPALLSDIKY